MKYTNNGAKPKKPQPPRWDSSPGVLSDFFPPKLPEPCPPPPIQANKSLAEKIVDVCQHYEVKCAGLEYESPASRYLFNLSREVQSLSEGLVEEQQRMRESSAFHKKLLREWEEQFGLDSHFMFHEVPRLRLPLSRASTQPADLAKALVTLGEDNIQLESELRDSRMGKEHSLEELKRALDEHVAASRKDNTLPLLITQLERSSAEDMRQRFELSVRKTAEEQERRIQFLEGEAAVAAKAKRRQAQLTAQNHKHDIEKASLQRQLQECTTEKEKLQQELETMRRERRFEIRHRRNISAAERYQNQDGYDLLSMQLSQTEPKPAATRKNEDVTDGDSSDLPRETQEQNKVMQDYLRNKDGIIESMRAIIKQLLDTNAKHEEPRRQLHRGGRVVEAPYVAESRAGVPQKQQQRQQPQEGLAAAKPVMEPFDLASPKRTEFLSSKFPPGIRNSPAAGPDAFFSIITR